MLDILKKLLLIFTIFFSTKAVVLSDILSKKYTRFFRFKEKIGL